MVKGLALPGCAEELSSPEGGGGGGAASPVPCSHHTTLPSLSAAQQQQEDRLQLPGTSELHEGYMAALLAMSFVMAPELVPPDGCAV